MCSLAGLDVIVQWLLSRCKWDRGASILFTATEESNIVVQFAWPISTEWASRKKSFETAKEFVLRL